MDDKSATVPLSPAQMERFHADGFVVVNGLLGLEEIARLVERVDGLLSGRYDATGMVAGRASDRGTTDVGRRIKQVMPMQYPVRDPVLRGIGDDPRIKAIAAQLLDTAAVEMFQQQALIKDPGQDNPTPWHQDDTYWRSGGSAVTAWFPLEPLYADCGTMHMIPGSHRGDVLPHARVGGISIFQVIQTTVDVAAAVPLLIPLGAVSFHHSKLIHGAPRNGGAVRRIALAQHYHAATTASAG
ncbi:MAG: phytanoyl-CoA dioxygenase family protein [Lentisphaerae bacterium]|nr:phytanoyl-CoA dioxygenase family protein [Lentisphaerota bacterium]